MKEIKTFSDRTEYYFNRKLHREDGPAVEYVNGEKHWYINRKRHRIVGPAVELANGYHLIIRSLFLSRSYETRSFYL